jgi:glycosyltransferase 2 family protein
VKARPVRLPSIGTLVRLVVALGLTVYILWQSRPALVLEHARSASPGPLVAAVFLVAIDRTLMALRWLWLLGPFSRRPDGTHSVSLGTALHVFFVSTFVGTFLPASIGSDAVRATAVNRAGVPLADAVASVFMDRVLGILALLIMSVTGLWLARDLPALAAVQIALVVTALGCGAVAAAVFSPRAAVALTAILRRLPWPRLHRAGSAVLDSVQRYATHHRLLAAVLGASVGVQIVRVFQAWCLGLGLGLAAPLSAYFAFVPLILLVMLLPITVNGLGTSQAAFVLFFTAAGVPAPGAFALSVLFVALGVVGNLPGGFLWARDGLIPTPRQA